MTKYIVKEDNYYGGKLRKKGETIETEDNLIKKYPKLFNKLEIVVGETGNADETIAELAKELKEVKEKLSVVIKDIEKLKKASSKKKKDTSADNDDEDDDEDEKIDDAPSGDSEQESVIPEAPVN